MDYSTILVDIKDKVATITLNRPEQSNAFTRDSYGEIANAVEELGKSSSVGAIVITGAGKHFSAGGDIKRFKNLIESGQYLQADQIMYAGSMSDAIKNCPKPTIAMVNGVATGAGLSCALACDFRVVTPKSKMIMGFVNLGLSGDTGSIYNLTRLVGVDKASMLMMTGRPCGGQECYEIGLASVLAAEEGLYDETYKLASELSSKSSDAIGAQKRLLRKYFYGDLEGYYWDEAHEIAACSRKPDFKEAVYAFLEKRTPEFNKGTE